MKIDKCLDDSCDNGFCFVECNNMITNILSLEQIEKVLTSNENKIDREQETLINNLKSDFQHIFYKLCDNFKSKYNRIITNNSE